MLRPTQSLTLEPPKDNKDQTALEAQPIPRVMTVADLMTEYGFDGIKLDPGNEYKETFAELRMLANTIMAEARSRETVDPKKPLVQHIAISNSKYIRMFVLTALDIFTAEKRNDQTTQVQAMKKEDECYTEYRPASKTETPLQQLNGPELFALLLKTKDFHAAVEEMMHHLFFSLLLAECVKNNKQLIEFYKVLRKYKKDETRKWFAEFTKNIPEVLDRIKDHILEMILAEYDNLKIFIRFDFTEADNQACLRGLLETNTISFEKISVLLCHALQNPEKAAEIILLVMPVLNKLNMGVRWFTLTACFGGSDQSSIMSLALNILARNCHDEKNKKMIHCLLHGFLQDKQMEKATLVFLAGWLCGFALKLQENELHKLRGFLKFIKHELGDDIYHAILTAKSPVNKQTLVDVLMEQGKRVGKSVTLPHQALQVFLDELGVQRQGVLSRIWGYDEAERDSNIHYLQQKCPDPTLLIPRNKEAPKFGAKPASVVDLSMFDAKQQPPLQGEQLLSRPIPLLQSQVKGLEAQVPRFSVVQPAVGDTYESAAGAVAQPSRGRGMQKSAQ